MMEYKNIAEFENATVAVSYEPIRKAGTGYQSEQQMEERLIEQLCSQGYDHVPIHTEAELVANLRARIEELNGVTFSETEWKRFFETEIARPNAGIVEKTKMLQESDTAISCLMDDGTKRNIRLIDKKNIFRNHTQVINQYVPEGGSRGNRYDVTILVNGLPMVHVELKRRGVNIREAFNQIDRYGRESFWAGNGLFEYIQIFVISNGTYTKYYSNTTRERCVKEAAKAAWSRSKSNTSNSFEFTSYWADAKNRNIPDIEDFTATFFSRNTLLNVLTKYCVFTVDKALLVMRPYQIAATEAIVHRVMKSTNYRELGTTKAGGYVWHATGSGKTLTSFKTARLISGMEGIDKVLFVVDRKDLDYQTMKEYNRFEENAVNGNRNTAVLQRHLEDPSVRILVTTIQKLSVFIRKNPTHDIYGKHVVIIFDECHRSQFGDMHAAIERKFKKYHIFGFTGTPIFPQNATSRKGMVLTTEQTFGDRLHTYTIINAIEDGNILKFKVDYNKTFRAADGIDDELVEGIDKEAVLLAPERIRNIVAYVLKHFAQKTKQDKAYEFRRTLNITEAIRRRTEEKTDSGRIRGFNSIFATQSIDAAKLYYAEFKRQQEALPEAKRLKVGLIYSFGANEASPEDFEDEENSESTSGLDKSSRDFLDAAIADYNRMFGTSYDTSDKEFENYYKDVSLRMKNKELDILVVVNMFLTGFDATTLNTLWVDKNLRLHGLIQAYSRTNRILNSVKAFGNIVCFRDLSKQTDEALALFGNREAGGTVLLRSFSDYLNGYLDAKGKEHKGYYEMVDILRTDFPNSGRDIIGESEEKRFITVYNAVLRLRNILSSFDEFEEADVLDERELQDYASTYQDLHDKLAGDGRAEKSDVVDDIVFEMEIIRQIEVNIDYILFLVEKFKDGGRQDREIIADIRRKVSSSPNLRNKKDLIDSFIESLNPEADSVTDEWLRFIEKAKRDELDAIIAEEGLKPAETIAFVNKCFREGEIKETGTEITRILPPMPLFTKAGDSQAKKEAVIKRLKAFYDRFYDISMTDI